MQGQAGPDIKLAAVVDGKNNPGQNRQVLRDSGLTARRGQGTNLFGRNREFGNQNVRFGLFFFSADSYFAQTLSALGDVDILKKDFIFFHNNIVAKGVVSNIGHHQRVRADRNVGQGQTTVYIGCGTTGSAHLLNRGE